MIRTSLLMAAAIFTLSTSVEAQQQFDVQAHRGGMALMPENTIPAMLNAVKLGARTLELDCIITADDKVMVSHDPYMSSAIMLKPDGSDIDKNSEKDFALYKMNYTAIRQFDAGSKPNARFPQQAKIKTYKPLLAELIDSVETYVRLNHLKPVFYNIETKSSVKGDGIFNPSPAIFTSLLMDVINTKGIAARTTIQSFDVRTLQIVHQKYPRQITALLIEKDDFDTNIKNLGFNPSIYSPYYLTVTPEMVKKAHDSKMLILPWTVDEESVMKQLMSYGVDGIITNHPEILIKLAGSYQK